MSIYSPHIMLVTTASTQELGHITRQVPDCGWPTSVSVPTTHMALQLPLRPLTPPEAAKDPANLSSQPGQGHWDTHTAAGPGSLS